MKRIVPFLTIAVTLGLAPGAGASSGPLDEARRAMERATFSGRLLVTWHDGKARRETAVTVRARGGEIEIDGPVPIVASGAGRFVRGATGWSALWPDLEVTRTPPDAARKYAVTRTDAGPTVAGRATSALVVREAGRVRERVAVDRATGLVLRREQLDDRGGLVRKLEFTSFDPAPSPMHHAPGRFATELPARASAASLAAPYRAPTTLPAGFQLLGAYRRGDVLQVVYGDGLYTLSLFEQPGRLDWERLPRNGRAVDVAGHRGRSYVWPGGHLVVWQGGDATYTVVGDAPAGAVLAAATALRGGRSLSGVQRLRQTARELVDTLSGRAG